MLRFRRLIVTLVLLSIAGTSLTPAPFLYAGEDGNTEAIVVTGSGYMNTLLESMLDTYIEDNDLDLTYRLDSVGSGPGFDVFCAGDADANMSTQPITDAQVLRCNDNGIEFVELVLGIDHAVLAVDADSQLSCLPTSDFTRIFRRNNDLTLDRLLPGASVEETVTVYGPDEDNAAFTYLRATFLNNLDPTIDETFDTPADIADDLRDAGDNGIALMTYGQWEALEQDGLKLLDMQADENAACVNPTPENLSTTDYPATRLLYMYANAASLRDGDLGLMLNFFLGESEAEATERPIFDLVRNIGFEPPARAILNRNLLNVDELIVGRTFTRTDRPAIVNTAAEGGITVGGNPLSIHITTVIFDGFGVAYELSDLDIATFGDDAAWEAFCNGEISVIQVGVTSEAPEDCGVTPYEVVLGADGVVFLTAADSTLPVCLDYTQIADLLVRSDLPAPAAEDDADDSVDDTTDETATDNNTEDAEGTSEDTATEDNSAASGDDAPAENAATDDSDDTESDNQTDDDDAVDEQEEEPTPPDFDDPQGPTMWSEVAPDWAADNDDLPILVLVPGLAALETDLVTSVVSPGAVLRRTDQPTIRGADAASGLDSLSYRLFSTASTEGAISYMRWSEFEDAPNGDDLRAIEIQNLDGECISPSTETILSGDYPFTFSARLVFAEESLNDPLIANLLWHTYDSNVLASLADIGLIGFERVELGTEREIVFALLEDIAAAEAEADLAPEETTPDDNGDNGDDESDATENGDADTEAPEADDSEPDADAPTEESTEEAPAEELGSGERDTEPSETEEEE